MAERIHIHHPREVINQDLRGESDGLFGLRFTEAELALIEARAVFTDDELEEMYARWRVEILRQDENPPPKPLEI